MCANVRNIVICAGNFKKIIMLEGIFETIRVDSGKMFRYADKQLQITIPTRKRLHNAFSHNQVNHQARRDHERLFQRRAR